MTLFSSTRRAVSRTGACFTVLVSALWVTGCGTSITVPTPPASTAGLINGGRDGLLVPLHVERSDLGHARLGLPTVIDGKAVYLMFDTGTRGVRVLSSALPRTSYAAAGMRTTLTFPTGAQASGPVVDVPFSMAGTKPVDIPAQSVDDVRCMPGVKRCVAMDGYTGEFGWAFSGILGAAADAPNDTCCAQPLRALPARIARAVPRACGSCATVSGIESVECGCDRLYAAAVASGTGRRAAMAGRMRAGRRQDALLRARRVRDGRQRHDPYRDRQGTRLGRRRR
jgi:hypothetical protein